MEEWKDIKGYEGHYQISSYGDVRSLDRIVFDRAVFDSKISMRTRRLKGITLTQSSKQDGYLKCTLSKNGKHNTIFVHQMMAITFLGHKPNGHEFVVDHINGDKHNNRLTNLRVITHRENNWTHAKTESNFKGATKSGKKWKSTISIDGKNTHLGTFDTAEEASNMYYKKLEKIC